MDKFNDIWKNRFNEGDMPLGDWNTPDEELWDNILPHVVPEKDKRRALLFWLFGGMLLAVLLVLTYLFTIKNSKAVSAEQVPASPKTEYTTVSEVIDESKKINTSPLEITKNKLPQDNEIAQDYQTAKSVISSAPGSFTKVQQRPTNLNINPKSKANQNISDVLKYTTPTSDVFISPEINQEEVEDDLIEKKGHSAIAQKELIRTIEVLNNLSSVELQEIISIEEAVILPLPTAAKIRLNDPKKISKLKWGVQTGALLWQHKISDTYQSDLAPFDFNYSNDIGYFVGMNAQVTINRYIDLIAGVQYEEVNTSSGHNSELAYDVNAEQGNRSNDYALSLATPYGLSEASFRFDRNDEVGEDAVDLLVDFKSSHIIQNLSFPIGLQLYPLGKKNRWMPSMSIGAGANYLIGITNSIQSIDTHHDAIQYEKSGASAFQSPAITKWYLDVRLGLGLGYQITKELQVDVNYNWSRGLNPIFEQNNYTTRIDRHYMSLGIKRSF